MSHIVNTDSYESSQNQGLMVTTWRQWLAEDTLNSVLGKTTVIFNLSCCMEKFRSFVKTFARISVQQDKSQNIADFNLSVESVITKVTDKLAVKLLYCEKVGHGY